MLDFEQYVKVFWVRKTVKKVDFNAEINITNLSQL
jgi:hypothetical protein